MKNILILIAYILILTNCSNQPISKEDAMRSYLQALAKCDLEEIKNFSVNANLLDCETYQTTIKKITCTTKGQWTTCQCEEEISGRSYFNGLVISTYHLQQINGAWKVVSRLYFQNFLSPRQT